MTLPIPAKISATLVLNAVTECFENWQAHKTRRAAIGAQRDVELAQIRQAAKIIKHTLDSVFAERRRGMEMTFRLQQDMLERISTHFPRMCLEFKQAGLSEDLIKEFMAMSERLLMQQMEMHHTQAMAILQRSPVEELASQGITFSPLGKKALPHKTTATETFFTGIDGDSPEFACGAPLIRCDDTK